MYCSPCTTASNDGNDDDDDDSKNDHRKISFRIGKKITPDQNRGQKLKLFHESLKQKWGELQKK